MDLAPRRRMAVLLTFAWIIVVTAVYYKRMGQLFLLGPADWIADNPSLADFHRALQVTLTSGLADWSIFNVKRALTSALLSMIGAALVFVATQTLGTGVCALIRCKFDHWMEKFVYRAGIGFGMLGYISLGMALMTAYRPIFVRLLVLSTATIGVILFLYWFLNQGMHLRGRRVLEEMRKRKVSFWHVIALLATLIALIGALAPEVEYDALWYHLWLPRLWLEQRSPVDMVSEYVSLYPMTWELIYGAGLVMGGQISAKLLNFICLPLTAMIIYQMVRRYMPQASTWVAIAIWITAPTVLWEATTAYIDLPLGFYVMLVVYSILRYTENRERSWIILAGVCVGLSLAIKHLALIVLVLVSAGLALKLWLASRNFKAVILPLTILVGVAFLIAFPWYARSWQASGNPVFPEFYSIFGADPPQRWDTTTDQGLDEFKAHFGRARTLSNLVTLPWDMTIHSAHYGGTLGPIFLMLVPLLVMYRNTAPGVSWLGWLTLLYIAFWASPLSSFQMRFLVPIVPLLAVLAAESFQRIRNAVRIVSGEWGKRALELGIIGLCLLNLPPFTSLHEFDRVVWDGWLTHVIHTVPLGVVVGDVSKTDYLNQKVPSYAAWHYINSHLARDSRILTFSGGDHFYSHRQRIPGDATMARDAVWVLQRGEEHRLLEQMNLLGITHILFDKRQMPDLVEWNLVIVQPEVISRWYVQEYEDATFILYRLVRE